LSFAGPQIRFILVDIFRSCKSTIVVALDRHESTEADRPEALIFVESGFVCPGVSLKPEGAHPDL
jgi:hypothetical protein